MPKQKFTMRISVNLYLVKHNRVLLLRRFNTAWKDGEYGVVAGHVDGNETLAAAMVREAKEEANITIQESDLVVIHAQHRISPDVEYIDFHVTTKIWSGEPTNLEPDKCDDLSWHSLSELPENTIPYIRHVFENIQKRIVFSEWREPGI